MTIAYFVITASGISTHVCGAVLVGVLGGIIYLD